jgi:hypothetical protein
MFSSAQADYVRYWLHAMKLTESTIPMPYSDCLMLKSAFRTVSPVTFETAESLKKAVKVNPIPPFLGKSLVEMSADN